jgi:protein-tyrosine-phosphatase
MEDIHMNMAFVCNGSSVRAQLAAGIAADFFKDVEIIAAGTLDETMDPNVLKVLEDNGMNGSGIKPVTLWDLPEQLDYAVVVGCDEGGCPLVFADKVIEWDITNPKELGEAGYMTAASELKEELKKLWTEFNPK